MTDWMDGGADGECHSAARTSPDGSPAETGRMCDGMDGGGGGADGECHSAARTSPDGSPAATGTGA